jgi:hypothetical protein
MDQNQVQESLTHDLNFYYFLYNNLSHHYLIKISQKIPILTPMQIYLIILL